MNPANNKTNPNGNPGTDLMGDDPMTRRGLKIVFGGIYAALFLFLFVFRAAPEQTLRASIGISATEEEVRGLLAAGGSISTVFPTALPKRVDLCAIQTAVIQSDKLTAAVLTAGERMRVKVVPAASRKAVTLTVEAHWQVHGGLLGNALDLWVGRQAREKKLEAELRRVKADAEQLHMKQA